MAELTLRTVARTQGNNRALKDGTVTGRRFNFAFEDVPVLVHAFRRMVRELAYDVSEMAFTTYLCARAHGTPFTAIPVFLARGFHHRAIVTGTATGLRHPKDLEGRRVGVNRGYTVTTGVWARAILQDEYGVDLDSVTWTPSGDEHVTQYRPPGNVEPLPPGADLAELVATGELAGAVGATDDAPGLVTLVPDASKAGYESLRTRGLYPINHLVVVRDELLAAHRDLAADVFTAFAEAKRRYVDQLRAGAGPGAEPGQPASPTDAMYRRVMDITGEDPLPYGIEPNRPVIEQLIRHAVDQKILERPVPVDELFADGTRDLVG